MATQTVHFRIGDRFGVLLMEIAQEHLTERNNPIQALKTITDSLHGCPTDLALRILKGEVVLPVDEEEQCVLPTSRIPELHDSIFPKVDPLFWIERRALDIENHADSLIDGFKSLQYQIRKNNTFGFDFDYEHIFKFVAGKNEGVLEALRDDREINAIVSLFETTKKFIETSMQIQNTMEWMINSFDEFADNETFLKYNGMKLQCSQALTDVMFVMKETVNFEFSMKDVEVDKVQLYIDAARENDEVISKGIKPVNIMDNYSAGWLSPEGLYYALNGEIANMLHIQIADALQEKGIIPEKDKFDSDVNASAWLEQAGWVKIHGNAVHFGGCLNDRIDLKNVDMTKKQIDIIYQYISKCHDGIMKLGWREQQVSIARFMMEADNLEGLYKRHFNY